MRRSIRRQPVPYKSPRLFSMVALLVCLLLMMNSLNNMRGPGQLAQKIISNLDASINQVGADQQPESQPEKQTQPVEQPNETPANTEPAEPAEAAKPATQVAEKATEQAAEQADSAVQNDPNKIDAAKGELEEFPVGESNVAGATNLNLREDLELQDWLGLAQDGTLEMQKLEMPAYWRILSVVKNAPFAELQKAANSKVRFNDLYLAAANHRSKLMTLTVNIRKITRYETEGNPAEVQELFEVWGWSDASKAWLYVFVTPELPPGLGSDTPVNQTAKFAGYFFKLQGYQPGVAKPNAKPLRAPLLIGKFELAKPAPRGAANAPATIEWIFGAIILLVGLIVILLRIFVFSVKKPKLSRLNRLEG
ncbi:MAG: hypothetical protein SFV81_26820 [Pirellulaceae bacterium]|nr:hypothetical protein [Pirellulaceae bacterium]